MWMLALAGCDIIQLFNDITNKVDELTDPIVLQTTLIGVGAAPEGTEFPQDADIGPVVTAMLADTTAGGDSTGSPILGATAKVKVGDRDWVMLTEATGDDETPGYTASAADGLVYEVGATAIVSIDKDDIQATAEWVLPEGLDFDVPCRVGSQGEMSLTMESTDYHSPLVTIVDSDGAVTWTNFPATLEEAVDLLNSGGINVVDVPGAEAFPADGPYLVGIAPVQRASTDAFEGVNISLSAFMAGQMRFWTTYAGEFDPELFDSAFPLGDTAIPTDTGCIDYGAE